MKKTRAKKEQMQKRTQQKNKTEGGGNEKMKVGGLGR